MDKEIRAHDLAIIFTKAKSETLEKPITSGRVWKIYEDAYKEYLDYLSRDIKSV